MLNYKQRGNAAPVPPIYSLRRVYIGFTWIWYPILCPEVLPEGGMQ